LCDDYTKDYDAMKKARDGDLLVLKELKSLLATVSDEFKKGKGYEETSSAGTEYTVPETKPSSSENVPHLLLQMPTDPVSMI